MNWVTFGSVALMLSFSALAHDREDNGPVSTPSAQPVAADLSRDARTYFTDTVLLDQHGQEVRFYSDVLAGKVVLLNVVFTQCKDACPLISRKLQAVREQLGEESAQIHFVSLSSDPVNDSPQALSAFIKKQRLDDRHWTFLTGESAAMQTVLTRLGQFADSPEAHSTLLIAGDVANKRWSKIRPDAPVQAVAQRLQLLAMPIGAE
jgi:cytochrome oxidase Cu insertion factor (SCO1/SenC/PrrC family)